MRILLYLVISFLVSLQLWGQQAGFDSKKLNKYYAKMAADWDIPGMSIGIVKKGELVFTGNYGVLEEGQSSAPNANTLYAIASNSKAFTSALIGMLVQEGYIDWDDKVKEYVPEFELYDQWVSNEVTVRDLLCHRVGLGTFSGDVIWYKSNLTSEEIVARMAALPPAYDFRAGYGYSNLMYVTAGVLIQNVTGKSWAENVQEKILEPLDMKRTIASVTNLDAMGNYATPHRRTDQQNEPIAWESWDAVAATGGLISCVNDIAKWMIFNLNHGIWNGDTLLTKATRNMVWRPHNNLYVDHTVENEFDRHFRAYGLGWGLSDYRGNLRVGHTGGYDGMITAVTLIPDEDLGIVVLTNGMKSPIMAATYYGLDLSLGMEPKDWSAELLAARNQREARTDTRVKTRQESRIPDTKPTLGIEKCLGTYHSEIYGNIAISDKDGQMRITFEHSPDLAATLRHWHYDVWEIVWDNPHAWFDFGTVKFTSDNNLNVQGLAFDVPNDDIFFEELMPKKIN